MGIARPGTSAAIRSGTRSRTQADVGPRQGDLFAQGQPAVNRSAAIQRLVLDVRSWMDAAARWLMGGDELLEQLAAGLRWTRAERPMYGEMVEEPRLGAHLGLPSSGVPAVIDEMSSALGRRYRVRFNSVWVNYYRGGQDSVAWHSDRIGIDPVDSVVAIVSLGGPRRLLLRPAGGGRSRSFTLASGDLLVMGGACQQNWEHSVPKVASAPPRMSVTFRCTASPPGR